jgi:hypothetical protein
MTDQALTHPAPATPASSSASRTWRTEDWIAVVLGFLVITTVLLAFQWKVTDLRNVVPTFRWTTNEQIELLTPSWNKALDAIIRDAEAKAQANVVTASRDLKSALATADRKQIEAAAAKLSATGPRTVAGALGNELRAHAPATTDKVFTQANLTKVGYVGLGFLIIGAIGVALIGWRTAPCRSCSRSPLRRASSPAMGSLSTGASSTSSSRWGSGCSSPTPSARRIGSGPRCRPSSSSRPASSSSAPR